MAVAPQMRLVEDNTSNISLTDIFKQVWLPNSYVWWYVICIGLTASYLTAMVVWYWTHGLIVDFSAFATASNLCIYFSLTIVLIFFLCADGYHTECSSTDCIELFSTK